MSDKKIGDKTLFIDIFSLTEEDWKDVREIPIDGLLLQIKTYLPALESPENSKNVKIKILQMIAQYTQIIACKLFDEEVSALDMIELENLGNFKFIKKPERQ